MTYKGVVGLGVTTWKRPGLFRECRASILRHLAGVVDYVVVVQDGGECYIRDCPSYWRTVDHGDNWGWARSKNQCLDRLVTLGCNHLFMIEDDVLVTDRRAVTGYIDAAEQTGLGYLSGHPWGEASTPLVEVDGPVTWWAYVGSWWTYMSRTAYQTAGGYDTVLGNVNGDIELVQRWGQHGMGCRWGRIPDATGSENWVEPRCLTPDQSTIMAQPDWLDQHANSMRWWQAGLDTPMPPEIRPASPGNRSRKTVDFRG